MLVLQDLAYRAVVDERWPGARRRPLPRRRPIPPSEAETGAGVHAHPAGEVVRHVDGDREAESERHHEDTHPGAFQEARLPEGALRVRNGGGVAEQPEPDLRVRQQGGDGKTQLD